MPKRRSAASADRAKRAAARASRVKKSGSFAETYLSYLLARASHIVASGFHAKLKTWNLSVPEYRVVFCLAGADGLGHLLVRASRNFQTIDMFVPLITISLLGLLLNVGFNALRARLLAGFPEEP